MPYKLNKASYLKRGSKIAQSGEEDALFDNIFEIELNEHYEDNFWYRNFERAKKEEEDRQAFRMQVSESRSNFSKSVLTQKGNRKDKKLRKLGTMS